MLTLVLLIFLPFLIPFGLFLLSAWIERVMKENGFKEVEEETEDGELRVSFEDAMIDFFFEGDKISAVSWGVLVDEQGDII